MMDEYHKWNRSSKIPMVGVLLSAIAVIVSVYVVKILPVTPFLRLLLIGCATLQIAAQLFFFLFLGIGSKPNWPCMGFLLTLITALGVIAGTLWIMHNLDYNMMPMP